MTSHITPGGHGLGLIPDTLDSRDRMYAAAPEHTPYKFVDLETDPAMPPIWDQGQLGSCTAHGTLACFLFAAAKCGAADPMLSRLQLYYYTRAIEGTTDQDAGGQIRDAIKASTQGIAPETDWPYEIAKFTEKPPAKAVTDAAANVDLEYTRVDVALDAIQACLTEGYPIDFGALLDAESFESENAMSTGIVSVPRDPQDGHCMAIVGIGTGADWIAAGQFPHATKAHLYLKVRNSWGTEVYQRGYLLMPVEYILKFASDLWTIRRAS